MISIPAPSWTPTAAEYHAAPGWSPSSLSKYLASPSYLELLNDLLPSDENPEQAHFALGSAVHRQLLQNDLDDITVIQANRKSKEFKTAFEGFRTVYPNRLLISQAENVVVSGMVNAVLSPNSRSANVAKTFIRELPGYSEWAGRFDFYGLDGKTMLDRVFLLQDRVAILDIKSTRSPDPIRFSRSCFDFGYHRQAAWNSYAFESITGIAPSWYYFIAIRNTAPYEVAVYEASEEMLSSGMSELLEASNRILAGETLEDWQTLPGDRIPKILTRRYR